MKERKVRNAGNEPSVLTMKLPFSGRAAESSLNCCGILTHDGDKAEEAYGRFTGEVIALEKPKRNRSGSEGSMR